MDANRKTYQRGFTFADVLIVISAIVSLSFIGLIAWAAIHFIRKFW